MNKALKNMHLLRIEYVKTYALKSAQKCTYFY